MCQARRGEAQWLSRANISSCCFDFLPICHIVVGGSCSCSLQLHCIVRLQSQLITGQFIANLAVFSFFSLFTSHTHTPSPTLFLLFFVVLLPLSCEGISGARTLRPPSTPDSLIPPPATSSQDALDHAATVPHQRPPGWLLRPDGSIDGNGR